jgi:glycosyltransferase involved in cell wall biosynthesis
VIASEPSARSASTSPRRRSILIVTAAFPPWGGGTVLRITKLVKYLAAMDWEITVIASDEAKPDVVDVTLVSEIPSAVRVIRVRGPLRAFGGAARSVAVGSARRRLLAPIASVAKVVLRSLLIPDWWIGWALKVSRLPLETLGTPSVVLSSGPPHSAHLAGSALARRLGRPHIVDLRDDWGEGPLHRHPAPWHGAIDGRLEARTLARAARIVTIYDTSRLALIERYPALRDRVSSIPNGYDPDDLEGLPTRVPSQPGSPVRFIHAGSLRGMQDVGRFFEVFGGIVGKPPGQARLRLLGFTSGRHEAIVRAAVPAWALDIDPPVSHREALEAMAASDVLVVFTGGGGAVGADTLTGKLYEYLALRRPILLIGPAGPAAELVTSNAAGVVADPADPASIRSAVDAASAMARGPVFRGAPSSALKSFSRQQLATEYDRLLGTLL